MRKLALCLLGLGVCISGCSLVGQSVHNLAFETCLSVEEHSENCRNQKLAQEAYAAIVAHGAQPRSADYAEGFQDGYADFLTAGGPNQPPPLPPQRYWKMRYQSPEGYAAIQDWYAGFHDGTAAAQEQGYRKWITVPSGLTPPHPVPSTAGTAGPPGHPLAAAPSTSDPWFTGKRQGGRIADADKKSDPWEAGSWGKSSMAADPAKTGDPWDLKKPGNSDKTADPARTGPALDPWGLSPVNATAIDSPRPVQEEQAPQPLWTAVTLEHPKAVPQVSRPVDPFPLEHLPPELPTPPWGP